MEDGAITAQEPDVEVVVGATVEVGSLPTQFSLIQLVYFDTLVKTLGYKGLPQPLPKLLIPTIKLLQTNGLPLSPSQASLPFK